MELSREWVAAHTGGRVVGHVQPEPVGRGIAFDSRVLEPGQVFVALHDVRDGHDFVGDARACGAAFAIVDRTKTSQDGDVGPVVEVEDTAVALTDLGRAARARIEAPVVAITGSVGKTSTKDLTAAALRAGRRVHCAPASFNNEIGVPVTLLGAPESAQAVVVEMGARFAGNIAALCRIAQPLIGVVTNIGLAHAEHLGGPDGVATVKGELLEALPAAGLAVINAECRRSLDARHRSAAPVLTVGVDPTADVRVSNIQVDAQLRASFLIDSPWGSGEITLGIRGAHQVVNAAQAASVALHLGIALDDVAAALAEAESTGWRMQLHRNPEGVAIINDAYNASPDAMIAAVRSLATFSVDGARIAVLGEMRELGEWSASEHARVGTIVGETDIDVLIAVGPETEPLVVAARAANPELAVYPAADAEMATTVACGMVRPGDAVLVKASRAVGLEVVAEALANPEPVA